MDVLKLWDFRDPAGSEEAFRAAMEGASDEDRLVILTQIARCRGLQGDFAGGRALLDDAVKPHLGHWAEVDARYHLERGRTLCSVAHAPEAVSEADREAARTHYLESHAISEAHRLDYLAIDALHMMVCVDPAPEDQLAWNLKAIAAMDASDQPVARLWEGSLTNNAGYALHLAGRYDEAIALFERSRVANERAGKTFGVRVARWMIAWTERVRGNLDAALSMQLTLEKEYTADGDRDPYVFQELEAIYRARGDDLRADHYRTLASTEGNAEPA